MPKRIIVATLLLTFTLSACRTWTPLDGVPDPIPDAVRVELVSGERVEVRDARLEADTLVGRIPGGDTGIRVHLLQIASLEEGRVSRGRTVLTVLGIGLLGLSTLVYVAFCSGDWC